MRLAVLPALWVALLGAATPPAIARAAAGGPSLVPAAADRSTLERVIEEAGVVTRRPDPGWGDYAREQSGRLIAWVATRLRDLGDRVGLPGGWLGAAAWVLAALGLIAAGIAALAVLRRRRRRRASEAPASAGATAAEPAPPERDWRAEIDRRLAAGRVADALEAAWWWLARALCGERFEASWTGGELVARGRRPDVAPAVARLDAMTYGPRRPAPGDVRALVETLERRLAAAGPVPAGAAPRPSPEAGAPGAPA